MNPVVLISLIFGIITLLNNFFLATQVENKSIGFILVSGLLFFNIYFSILFTKKAHQYTLSFSQGFKAAIQSGIIQSVFYFSSIVLIQKYISPNYFPDLYSLKQYILILNINIILFSILSAIFGAVLTSFLMTKNLK
jgi:hypothetical protein